jgi:hypothetical protein
VLGFRGGLLQGKQATAAFGIERHAGHAIQQFAPLADGLVHAHPALVEKMFGEFVCAGDDRRCHALPLGG